MILITTSIYGQSRRDIDCRNDKCAEMTELTIKNKYSNLNVYVNNSLIENDSLVLFCLPLASKYQIKAEINGNRAFFEKGKMINCKESVEIEIKEPYRKSHKWLLFGGILGATASSIVSFSSYNTFGMDESVIMGIYMTSAGLVLTTIGVNQMVKNKKWKLEILPEIINLKTR